MPSQTDVEKDPFLVLLSDALRAGPGSPQWHDAVAALRQKGLDGTDEHRLLIRRANLTMTVKAMDSIWDSSSMEDRGDGVLMVVRPDIPTQRVMAQIRSPESVSTKRLVPCPMPSGART